METRLVRFENTKHLRNYPGYAVDTEGNVWSFKHNKPKILSPGWKKRDTDYKTVLLSDNTGKRRSFLVHRLVALTFIPTDDITMKVSHRNNDCSDNRLENLEWITKQKNKENNSTVNGFSLDSSMSKKLKEVHSASIRKGLPVPDSYEFMNTLIEGALEQYINQYGLRKVMNSN